MRTPPWASIFLMGCLHLPVALATPESVRYEPLQVPQCLAAILSPDFTVLAENKDFKIIDVPVSDLATVSRLADQIQCGRFINLSQKLSGASSASRQQAARKLLQKPRFAITHAPKADYRIAHQKEVQAALEQVDADNIWQALTQLTSFINRSASQESGVKTAAWLKGRFEAMAIESGREDTATFYVATGGRYIQPSLVTVIGKGIQAPAVVVGAHMDTLGESAGERMPGAGDDGSGSASAMEVARVLLSSKATFKRPIYIIWYAAEEQGLIGSQQVVQHFMTHSIPVHAAIQFDMTGFRNQAEDKTMWVFRDYTDRPLSDFIASLIQRYIKVPVAYSTCGYGCSDHASWNAAGIPAAFPCETSFEAHNPYIHTPSDSMDLLNLEHMTNFTKLGLAFAIELAGVA